MGVVLPDELAWFLDLIGIMWPNVDEDDYREMATALREFADDVDHGGGGLHEAVAGLLGATEGPAIDAFDAHWSKVGSHLGNLADAGRLGATALDGVALVIEGAKIGAVVQLGILATELIAAQAAAPFTLGLSELGAAGATQATRIIVKRLFKEAAQQAVDQVIGLATGPVYAALGNMAGDLAIQLGANALGVQHGVDLGRAADAGKDGFQQGVEDAEHQVTGGKDGGFVLASAGGGGAGGGGGGGGGGGSRIRHDESAYDDFDASVGDHGEEMRSRGRDKIARARGHHSRTKGRGGELTQAAEQFIETVITGVHNGLDNATSHITGDMRRGVRQMHSNHKDNDERTAADLIGLHKTHSAGQLQNLGDKTPVYLVDEHGTVHRLGFDDHDPTGISRTKADSANDPLVGRLIDGGNPLPGHRKKSVPLGRTPPGKEGPRKRSEPVEAGSTDLSRATQMARHALGDYGNRNYAAFRIKDGDNEFILVGHSTDSRHSERVLGIPLIRGGTGGGVTEAYTERAPCRTYPYYCGEWLQRHLPEDVQVSHSFEYGENATGATPEALKQQREASQARGNDALNDYTNRLGRHRR